MQKTIFQVHNMQWSFFNYEKYEHGRYNVGLVYSLDGALTIILSSDYSWFDCFKGAKAPHPHAKCHVLAVQNHFSQKITVNAHLIN